MNRASSATRRRRKSRRRKAAFSGTLPSKRARVGGQSVKIGEGEAAAGAAAFEACYREQFEHHGVLRPGEWHEMLDVLHRPLPVTFRFTKRQPRGGGNSLRRSLDSVSTARRAYGESEPKRLPWGDGWQLGFHKRQLKVGIGRYATEVREWLAQRASSGCVVRQEAVSMLPVICLDVKPGHRCGDLCAAPGSKTTQLLEASFGGGAAAGGGLVVANDVSAERAYALVRRCAVLAGSAAHLLVITHRAQTIPTPAGGFDRIVCDVPCCGDGTLRKEPGIWKRWSPNFGTSLHTLQLQIAMRGIALLKVGGKMVYSTCTFNPIENEAVVSEVLRRCGGAVQLVDASTRLPRAHWRPGMPSWRVAVSGHDDAIRFVESYDASKADLAPEVHKRMRRSMWPPAPDSGAPSLEHCMRFLPHLHDTGGFFVAVLVKRSALKVSPRVRTPPSASSSSSSSSSSAAASSSASGTGLIRGTEPTGRKRWGPMPQPLLQAFLAPFFADPIALARVATALGPSIWGAPPYYRSGVLVTPALRKQLESASTDDDASPLRLVAFGAKVLISPTERKKSHPSHRELTPFGVTLLLAHATRTVECAKSGARALLKPVIASAQRDRHYIDVGAVATSTTALPDGPCIIVVRDAALKGGAVAFGGWMREGKLRATMGERGKGREMAPQAEALLVLEHLAATDPPQRKFDHETS